MRIITTVLVLMTCGLATVSAEIQVPEGVEITDTNLWTPFVEVLRVRETPDLNGKVVATIKLGEQVEYAGETSANQSTVDFNGEKITDSWIKVKLPDGKTGWAWRGFLLELSNIKDKDTCFSFQYPKNCYKVIKISYLKLNSNENQGPPRLAESFNDKNFKLGDIDQYFRITCADWNIEKSINYLTLEWNITSKNNYEILLMVSIKAQDIYKDLYKYLVFTEIDISEYEKVISKIITDNYIKKIFKDNFTKQEKTYQCTNSKTLDNGTDLTIFWEYLYQKKYIPTNVYGACWMRRNNKMTSIDNFISDINNNKLSYYITMWYNMQFIIQKSMIIEQ